MRMGQKCISCLLIHHSFMDLLILKLLFRTPSISTSFLSRTILGWSSPETVYTKFQVLASIISSSLTPSVSWTVFGLDPQCHLLVFSLLKLSYHVFNPPPQVHESLPSGLQSFVSSENFGESLCTPCLQGSFTVLITQPLPYLYGTPFRNVPFIPLLCFLAHFLDSLKLCPHSDSFSSPIEQDYTLMYAPIYSPVNLSFHKHLLRPSYVSQSFPYPSDKCGLVGRAKWVKGINSNVMDGNYTYSDDHYIVDTTIEL